MNNLQAIKASVNFPISDEQAELALTDWGLTTTQTYSGVTMEFELAKADILRLLVSSANIAEGGYSISMTDKSNMLAMAKGIYAKHGIAYPDSMVSNISDLH